MGVGQAVLGAVMSWGALLANHGLYSPGMVNVGYATAGLVFLYSRRNLCLSLLRLPARERAVSWRNDVWPFQWRIGVSSVCALLAVQIFAPVLFLYRGPAEADQFGMSLSITTYLSTLVLAWMSTKATPFGQMIARSEFRRAKALFFRTLLQALSLLAAMAVACEMAVIALRYLVPRLAVRIVSPQVFALLLVACVGGFIVQSMAVYLRSFKREPFLVRSVVVAVSTVALASLAAKTLGIGGVALSYFVCTGGIGLTYGVVVFRRSYAH